MSSLLGFDSRAARLRQSEGAAWAGMSRLALLRSGGLCGGGERMLRLAIRLSQGMRMHTAPAHGEVRGCDAAVAGTLFDSVYKVKTHANMGNLFGWIHGDKPEEFRQETWARYVESLGD